MHYRTILPALVAIAPDVNAHYMFVRFSHKGVWEAPLGAGGIRNRTAPFEEQALYNTNYYTRVFNDPTYHMDYPNSVRCGRGNMDHANETAIIDVDAGDTIEVAHESADPVYWRDDYFNNCPGDRGTCDPRWNGLYFIHWGPMIVHLSKAPDGQDARTYDGSGDWVKIYTFGLRRHNDSTFDWPLYGPRGLDLPRFTFKIPVQTPPGQYLMRMDVPWIGQVNSYGHVPTQMYPSCAQLSIRSNSTAAFPKGVKMPDIFMPEAPGMETSPDMRELKVVDEGFVYPGGPLWDGETMVVDKP
ncbi:glycosyl hydrolase family 61-domain-containing protein [Lophiotrema nucula]|uniref:AA9 family lytic polysaccharide monooxygenase n=1 Tax=Lophiotrema nucula TaxID=690887 RepID=A0A6A5YIX7_9PLEO|nr:glycosyl hydrolase family 61-domain-containing protein [Lophiotrema nucula]